MRSNSGIAAFVIAALWLLPVCGQSNLEGIWTNGTVTPLERPADLAANTVDHRRYGWSALGR